MDTPDRQPPECFDAAPAADPDWPPPGGCDPDDFDHDPEHDSPICTFGDILRAANEPHPDGPAGGG